MPRKRIPVKHKKKAQRPVPISGEDLAELGKTVYGPSWKIRCEERLGINRSTLGRWQRNLISWDNRRGCAAVILALKYLQEHPEEA